jgi:GNAT superfamily N-acetyltransferase
VEREADSARRCEKKEKIMRNIEVIRLVDQGANFYCRQLGNASHMEYQNLGYYSIIYPKPGEMGGTSIFNVSLENLSDEKALQIIDEIKRKNVHTWWGLCLSDRVYKLVFGTEKPVLSEEEHENDEETYMAMFPEEMPKYETDNKSVQVKKVQQIQEFRIWSDICNLVLHGDYPIIHRENHFKICQDSIMSCYIGHQDETAMGISATLFDDGNASLEFVATLPEYRNKGVATRLCQIAIEDVFSRGAKIITTRAFQDAKKIYRKLGFRSYY